MPSQKVEDAAALVHLSYEKVWRMPKMELVSNIEDGLFHNSEGKIRFYAPSFAHYKTNYFESKPIEFPTISITGSSCALKCKHCGGRFLNTMISAPTPNELTAVCIDLKERGCQGILISGGCLPDGSIPLGKFAEAIARVKQNTKLTVIVHTGIIDYPTAEALSASGVDAALIDVIGSDETIREIYNLNVKADDYGHSLSALTNAGVPIIPHVLVGLHYGRIKGELQALRMISEHSPSAVIVIALMPTQGTAMEKVNPPTPDDIARVMVTARVMMPDTPVALGCMRPKGQHRIKTDMLAVESGVNAIAFPSEEAIRLAESLGLDISFSSMCCSQIFLDTHQVH